MSTISQFWMHESMTWCCWQVDHREMHTTCLMECFTMAYFHAVSFRSFLTCPRCWCYHHTPTRWPTEEGRAKEQESSSHSLLHQEGRTGQGDPLRWRTAATPQGSSWANLLQQWLLMPPMPISSTHISAVTQVCWRGSACRTIKWSVAHTNCSLGSCMVLCTEQ